MKIYIEMDVDIDEFNAVANLAKFIESGIKPVFWACKTDPDISKEIAKELGENE